MDKYLPASNATAGNITIPAAAAPFDAASVLVLIVTLCAFCAPVFVLFPPFPPRKSDALPVTHTRLGLQPSKSNLRDHRAADRAGSGAAEVKSLFVYPIKSCRGIEVTRAKVVHTGLEFDRLFTFAQLKSAGGEPKDDAWEFITQRAFPLLATLEVELWQPDLDKLRGGERETKSDETFLVLRFPHRRAGAAGFLQAFAAKCLRGWRAVPEEEILLPVGFPSAAEITAKGYTRERVRVWKDTATALNMGNELPEALAQYLGVRNRLGLFRIDPEDLRPVLKCAPAKEAAGYQPVVSFQDSVSAPSLLLCIRRNLVSRAVGCFTDQSTYVVPPARTWSVQCARLRDSSQEGRRPTRSGPQEVPRQRLWFVQAFLCETPVEN